MEQLDIFSFEEDGIRSCLLIDHGLTILKEFLCSNNSNDIELIHSEGNCCTVHTTLLWKINCRHVTCNINVHPSASWFCPDRQIRCFRGSFLSFYNNNNDKQRLFMNGIEKK